MTARMGTVETKPTDSLITVGSIKDADLLLEGLRRSATKIADWISNFQGDPLQLVKHMKFDTVGFHPITHHPLNLIEQVNQTWTFAVALLAARQLLKLHPEAGPFLLAPGAHASQDLDIMSSIPGLVGAETFAAVKPTNNNKLFADLTKLLERPEVHRYVFFMSPGYPGTQRLSKLERGGPVQVWSIDFDA